MQKENQRIRMTKKILKDTLITMLRNESIHKISIRELCDNADINRSTFYNHYSSQYDLLSEIENELLNHIQDSLYRPENNEKFENIRQVASLLSYLEQNRELARLLINNNIDPEFPQKLIKLPKIQELIKYNISKSYSEHHLSYASDFVIHGGYNMVRTWINKDNRETAEEIATLLMKLVDSVV